ncbi:MAG TPA: LytTR family DNA-binding domain-containing protein [Longimicrobiaceae bacterium]|nr:LytTR family DNA-binding domain-containing protein [Longimicrobiaceae bacterium]
MIARIRVAIADDEPLARQRLRSLLSRHADLEVVAECANGLEAVTAVATHRPDLLFLDVQMPGMTGVETLCSLGDRAVPAVVFVTAHDEHAVEAFEHQALDYLLKPVSEERFARMLGRVRERLAEKSSTALTGEVLRRLAEAAAGPAPPPAAAPTRPERLLVRSGPRLRFVEVADVDWIEADGDYVRLHTGKTSHLMRSTLAAVEAQLDPARFVRIHRSTIVRTSRIREMEPYFRGEFMVVLDTGAKLKMSRSYRERLQSALGQEL